MNKWIGHPVAVNGRQGNVNRRRRRRPTIQLLSTSFFFFFFFFFFLWWWLLRLLVLPLDSILLPDVWIRPFEGLPSPTKSCEQHHPHLGPNDDRGLSAYTLQRRIRMNRIFRIRNHRSSSHLHFPSFQSSN